MQEHTCIVIQNLKNKPCFHIRIKISYTSVHKFSKNGDILQTNSKNHLLCHNDRQRNGSEPVLVSSFFNNWCIHKNQCIIVFHFNTGAFFFIQRGTQIIHFDLISVTDFKNLRSCRVCKCNPASFACFFHLVHFSINSFKNSDHGVSLRIP